LVGIEDFRSAIARERFLERLDAEISVDRVGETRRDEAMIASHRSPACISLSARRAIAAGDGKKTGDTQPSLVDAVHKARKARTERNLDG